MTTRTLRRQVWLLPAALVLHELEEWNILAWYDAHWVHVDPATMTPASVHVWLVFASVAGLVGTLATVTARRFALVLQVLFLPAFVAVVFGHALAHLYWTWLFRSYSPGVVTSVVCIVPATLYVLDLTRREALVSIRYLVLLLAASALPVVVAVGAGNRVPDGGVPWLRFSTWLIERWAS